MASEVQCLGLEAFSPYEKKKGTAKVQRRYAMFFRMPQGIGDICTVRQSIKPFCKGGGRLARETKKSKST